MKRYNYVLYLSEKLFIGFGIGISCKYFFLIINIVSCCNLWLIHHQHPYMYVYNNFLRFLGNEEAYSYLPFGERDKAFRGDDVTSAVLRSPTTVYAGNGSQGGFNFVQVSFFFKI